MEPTPTPSASRTGPDAELGGDADGDRVAVVVGFDPGPGSLTALVAAVDFTRRLSARLVVVHAVAVEDYPVDPDAEEWEFGAHEVLVAERAAAVGALEGCGVPWSFHAWHGDPVHVLARAADEVDALMIVVGAHPDSWRHLLERLGSPSVAHRLLHRTTRPVLVVGHHTRHGLRTDG